MKLFLLILQFLTLLFAIFGLFLSIKNLRNARKNLRIATENSENTRRRFQEASRRRLRIYENFADNQIAEALNNLCERTNELVIDTINIVPEKNESKQEKEDKEKISKYRFIEGNKDG